MLLGLRSVIKSGLETSPAELLYGCSLRLPGELVSPKPPSHFDYGNYIQRLRNYMRQLKLPAYREQHTPVFIPKSLHNSSHVFVRVDGIKQPLQHPYIGPYRVLQRGDKTYIIDKEGKHEMVSIDRLKPAFIETPLDTPPVDQQSHPSSVDIPDTPAVSQQPETSRSTAATRQSSHGRKIRLSVRFADYVDLIHG